MAFTTLCLARYLAELGWRAIPSGNNLALSIPLAASAGLGELGRNGNLITQRYGPCVRLCKVFTDLPLAPDRPVDLGVQARCESCEECVTACPAGALDERRDASLPGALSHHLDADKCRSFWQQNGTGCSNCVAVCTLMPA